MFAIMTRIHSRRLYITAIVTTINPWQAERHVCHLRFTGAATIKMISMFSRLDPIGSAVGKRPIGHAIATSEWPTEY